MKRIWSKVLLGAAFVGAVLAFGSVPQQADARICPFIYRPVCGLSPAGVRVTYANACLARAAHAKILAPGKCLGPICDLLWKPVCAIDPFLKHPRTFSSLCWAEIHNAVFLYNGPCH